MRKIEPKKEGNTMEPSVVGLTKSKKQTKVYPRIHLEHEFFPETSKWKVGKEYNIEMRVKMTGLSISKFQNDSEFEVLEFDSEDAKEEDSESKSDDSKE